MKRSMKDYRRFLHAARLAAANLLLVTLALGVLACATTAPRPGGAKHPSVLYIVTDDLGPGDLACYGNRVVETPNLDRLASEGTRFTNAYAAGPVGAPTFAAALTGKFPARLGLTGTADARPATDRAARPLQEPAWRRTLGRE